MTDMTGTGGAEMSEATHAHEAILTKEEFCARFKAEMLRIAAYLPIPPKEQDDECFQSLDEVAEYADQAAPTYWDEPDQRAEGPEECARSDVSYWGE